MPRELTYTIETRQSGEPWRVNWRGPGEQVACAAARALAKETRRLAGFNRSIPIYPHIRVRQGKRIVVFIGPTQERGEG